MTLPYERTCAVIRAREFLSRLSSPYGGGLKGIPRAVRQEARAILRHYPFWFDLGRRGAFDEQAAMAAGNADEREEIGVGH